MMTKLRTLTVLALLLAVLAACGPTPTPEVVEKVVTKEVEKVVTQVVKETVIVEVEGTPQVVEKEVVITATPEPVEEVNLEVWYLSQSPEEIQLIEGLSNKFAEKHPGVTVTISPYGFDDMNKTIKLALDSGTGPDVAYVSPGAGAGHVSYAQAGHLVELTDIAKERGWDQRHPIDSIMYWQKELGGPIWGVPFDITNVGVFYNKDLFDELGLKPPQTFDEFDALLATLKDAGYTPFSTGALDGWPFDHYFMILVHVTTPIEKIEALNYLQPGVSLTEDSFVEDEIIGFVKRILRGMRVDGETCAYDVIERVGIGGMFLTDDHTLNYWQGEFWVPQLCDRNLWEPWAASGSKTMLDRAIGRQEKILSTHTLEWLDEDIQQELDAIVAGAEREILGA